MDTFIPTDKEIEASFKEDADKVALYKGYAAAARSVNPDGIYRFQGERRLVPAGHFDAISAFVISGQLTNALKQGIEYAPVTNIDNLQAILKNDGMIAAFAESNNDFGFILAEKNIEYKVLDAVSSRLLANVVVRYRDNIISFDGMNEFQGEAIRDGIRFVINQQQKTVDVFDPQGQKVSVKLTAKPETGGTLVQYKDDQGNTVVTMKEGFELPKDFDHQNAPFFNTNTVIMRLRSLLGFLNVTEEQLANMSFDERAVLVRDNLVKKIKANFEFKNHEVEGEFPELGVVEKKMINDPELGDVEKTMTNIPVVQLTRIMLQVVQISGAKIGYFFAPRQDVFAPVKGPEDMPVAARNNEESLKPYLAVDHAGRIEDNVGGIDFNPSALSLKVERAGKGVAVRVDPAEVQRIKAGGVCGFTPVIIDIMPVKDMLSALGLAA